MSLFIAGQAFPMEVDFAASKIAVFIASVLSVVIGTALLWGASSPTASEEELASEAVLGTLLDQ
jgi:NhaA family Na+:H+ antiporter